MRERHGNEQAEDLEMQAYDKILNTKQAEYFLQELEKK